MTSAISSPPTIPSAPVAPGQDSETAALGQALVNDRRLRLSQVPANYLQIRSATGSAAAVELLERIA